MPFMNATGTKTETIENVVAATASPISSVPLCDAVTWSSPSSMWRTMFSRTTIASSIRMPIASESPRSDIVLSVKPQAHTAMNAASVDTGSARPVITVERQLIEEQEDDQDRQQRPLDQRLLDVAHGVPHTHAGVLDDRELDAGRQGSLDRRHVLLDLVRDTRRTHAHGSS